MDAIATWQEQIRRACERGERGTGLRIRGGGSKDFYGDHSSTQEELLDTRAHQGIVAYEPEELFIHARCGTPLADIEAALSSSNQILAFEPPGFGPEATFGGAIAAGLGGPRQFYAGRLRNSVLGVTVLDGQGMRLQFGGRMVKNVAGYDVARLMAGARGTLGVICEGVWQTRARSEAEWTLAWSWDWPTARRHLQQWVREGQPLSASCWHRGALRVRLSDFASTLRLAHQQMGGDRVEDGENFWRDVKEQRLDFFQPSDAADAALWRLNLPEAAVLPDDALMLIEGFGSQRWLYGAADDTSVRQQAMAAGGHATLFRSGQQSAAVEAFSPQSPALTALAARIRAVFDPHGIFNRTNSPHR